MDSLLNCLGWSSNWELVMSREYNRWKTTPTMFIDNIFMSNQSQSDQL